MSKRSENYFFGIGGCCSVRAGKCPDRCSHCEGEVKMVVKFAGSDFSPHPLKANEYMVHKIVEITLDMQWQYTDILEALKKYMTVVIIEKGIEKGHGHFKSQCGIAECIMEYVSLGRKVFYIKEVWHEDFNLDCDIQPKWRLALNPNGEPLFTVGNIIDITDCDVNFLQAATASKYNNEDEESWTPKVSLVNMIKEVTHNKRFIATMHRKIASKSLLQISRITDDTIITYY